MTAPQGVLVIAADPLLRKSATEVLARLGDGGVEAVPPSRATPERIGAAEIVVLAAFGDDLPQMERAIEAVAAAARPILLITAGTADTGRPVASRLKIPSQLCVLIPELNIRDELLQAAPRLEAALKQARSLGARASPPPAAAATGGKPIFAQRVSAVVPGVPPDTPYLGPVVCIGASTGGTDAVLAVLSGLAPDSPPIAIVQHMPEAYVGDFAERLDRNCVIDVELARDNIALRPGLAVVAPGGRQLRVRKDAKGIWIKLGESERIGGHSPAVDVLMKSASEELGRRAIGVLLTGMGRDGAEGLLAMRRAGARTAAQDEATSVVYGMPKAAQEIGAADSILALPRIAGWISGLTPTLKS